MKFLQDSCQVVFNGIDKAFNVSSVFCEFTIGGKFFSIKWYGVIIAFGFILAVLYGGRRAYTWKMDLNKMVDILIAGTICGIIGARAYFVAFKWDYYSANPMEIFQIWHGGLAIYGGVIGGLLGAFIASKIVKLNFYNLLDLIGMSLLIGQGIGRWGNYANQEAFGCNTDSVFGMMSSKTTEYILTHQDSLPGVDPFKPVHPTFFYESVWCLLGFLILYLVCRYARKFSGQMFLMYVVWYGTGRFFIEGLRTDSLYIANTNIRVSQLLSIVAAAVSLILLIAFLIKYTIHPKKIEGVDYFLKPEPFEKDEEKTADENQEKHEDDKKENDDKVTQEITSRTLGDTTRVNPCNT